MSEYIPLLEQPEPGGNSVNIPKVVNILKEDDHFLENWESFCREIPLEAVDIRSLKEKFNHERNFPNLLTNMMNTWVSRLSGDATFSVIVEKFRVHKYRSIADNLQNQFENGYISSSLSPLKTVLSENERRLQFQNLVRNRIGNLSRYFAGRADDLNKLSSIFFESTKSRGRSHPVFAITGVSGIGKTELARAFTIKFQEDNGWDNSICIWLPGENVIDLERYLKDVLKKTGHTSEELKNAKGLISLWELVKSDLINIGKNTSVLVVFDNLFNFVSEESKGKEVLKLFCHMQDTVSYGCNFMILITMTETENLSTFFSRLHIDHIPLGTLSEQESWEILGKDQSKKFELDENVKALLKSLGYFPLAVKHAASIIRLHPNESAVTLCAALKANVHSLVNEKSEFYHTSSALLNKAASRMNKFQKIGNAALWILMLFSVMPNQISKWILRTICKEHFSFDHNVNKFFDDAIRYLIKHDLLKGDDVLTMHELNQIIAKDVVPQFIRIDVLVFQFLIARTIEQLAKQTLTCQDVSCEMIEMYRIGRHHWENGNKDVEFVETCCNLPYYLLIYLKKYENSHYDTFLKESVQILKDFKPESTGAAKIFSLHATDAFLQGSTSFYDAFNHFVTLKRINRECRLLDFQAVPVTLVFLCLQWFFFFFLHFLYNECGIVNFETFTRFFFLNSSIVAIPVYLPLLYARVTVCVFSNSTAILLIGRFVLLSLWPMSGIVAYFYVSEFECIFIFLFPTERPLFLYGWDLTFFGTLVYAILLQLHLTSLQLIYLYQVIAIPHCLKKCLKCKVEAIGKVFEICCILVPIILAIICCVKYKTNAADENVETNVNVSSFFLLYIICIFLLIICFCCIFFSRSYRNLKHHFLYFYVISQLLLLGYTRVLAILRRKTV